MSGRDLRKRPGRKDDRPPVPPKRTQLIDLPPATTENQPSTSRRRPYSATENLGTRQPNLNPSAIPPKRRRFTTYGAVREPLDISDIRLKDRNLSYFYGNIEDQCEVNETYQHLKYDTKFTIQNVRHSNNPAGLLYKFFEAAISTALNAARLRLNHPKDIAIYLYNANLEAPIVRPLREITSGMNDAMGVLREFAKTEQSARHGSLLDAETRMEINIMGDTAGGRCSKTENL